MRTLLATTALFCVGMAVEALATPSLTRDQSTRLQAAMDAQGCAGGNISVGESGFEIVRAECGGRIYDLVFDHEYKLLKKDARN
jgi:hypothetical protein